MLERLQDLSDFCARGASSELPVKAAPFDLRRGNMQLALAWSLFSFIIALALAFHWSEAPGQSSDRTHIRAGTQVDTKSHCAPWFAHLVSLHLRFSYQHPESTSRRRRFSM
jgi:hypothetical protein